MLIPKGVATLFNPGAVFFLVFILVSLFSSNSCSSRGPWRTGNYNFQWYNPHNESAGNPDSQFGSNGNFIFDVTGCQGCGVHSGRQDSCDQRGRCGEDYATNGCIRTTDYATSLIRFLHNNGDTVRTLEVYR